MGLMSILVACGGSTTTSTSTSSSNTTSSSTQTATTAKHGNGARSIAGTISQYNASTRSLTIKETDGTTQTFTITRARITKYATITQQQLGTLLSSGNVQIHIMTSKGSSSTAQTIMVMNAPAQKSNTTNSNTTMSNKTPNTNASQMAGTMRQINLEKATLSGNQLTGTNRTGQSVTVTLDSATKILQQATGSASDLQVGQTVVVAVKANSTTARSIVIGGPTAMGA